MKYFSVISAIFVLLFSGCAVDVVSRTDYAKIYASATSCGDDSEKTQADAVNELTKNYPLIAEDLSSYIKVQKRDANGTVCYDAFITKRGWDRYTRAFKNRQQEIIQYADENAKVFEYNNKKVLIKTMLKERRQFNQKLESAKKLAPMDIEPFLLDYKSLENAINVLPSVKIKVHPCNHNRNYNCDIVFSAEVQDESKKLLYLWDFGEGSKSEKKKPVHRYTTEGSYNVSLQVTDESGLSTFRTEDVLVIKSKNVPKTAGKNSLKAYFILDKKSYSVNEEVDFDNRSRSVGSEIESYLWDFGDGKTSGVRNPKHRYEKAGRYVVKYKVCNGANHCAYASSGIKIVPKANAVKPVTKKVKPVQKRAQPVVAKAKKTRSFDARAGESIDDYIARRGQPSEKIDKKEGSTKAYKFGNVWLLVKYDKIMCAVEEKGFKTTLLGKPKKCNWHKKYAEKYMLDLQ
ncbi:PKD domain-containing protein [Sulfurimonas sp. HSL3-7]|uniref:PKD domain-containing protein n=1 Tax=Sulfonitrofixus jiaomeiensis TaxID=3131938 RepID=UPI0031FA03D0